MTKDQVGRFTRLLIAEPGEMPGQAQSRARAVLPDSIARSRFQLRVPGQPPPAGGRCLLVGIAPWSVYDMKLLDLLDTLPNAGLRIEVFDSDTFGSVAAIEALLPGINVYAQSPFVGYWLDGTLTEVGAGYAGRHLVAKVCGIDPEELDRVVLSRPQPA